MKHTFFFFLFLIFCSTIMVKAFDKDFIYATYTVGARLKTPQYISSRNVQEFDFVYLVASPNWVATDFDGNQEEINRKYVFNFDYTSLYGNNYVLAYVDSVHQIGKKVLCSFPGKQLIEIASVPQRRAKFAAMMAGFTSLSSIYSEAGQ